MKKTLKKPLIYKEWIGCRWMILIMTFALVVIKYIPISNLLGRYKASLALDSNFVIDPYWFNNKIFDTPENMLFLFPLILILVVLLFKTEKQTSTCGLIMSMPFKRKDIIINKYIVGAFSIFIAFLINFLIMSVLYVGNVEFIKTSYTDIPMWYLINFLYCILFFTFSMFMQTVMGKYLVATFFTPIFFFIPISIVVYVSQGLGWVFSKSLTAEKLNEFILPFNIYSVIEGSRINIGSKLYKYLYINYAMKILYVIVIISVFIWLLIYCYKKIDMERIHSIFLFKKFQIIFNILISINVAMIISIIIVDGIGFINSNISFIVVFLIVMSISYSLCNKIIRFANR